MKIRLAPATVAIALLCAAAAPSALADSSPKLSNAVGKPLIEAQKLLQSGDAQGALAKIKEAQAAGSPTDYDTYVINEMLFACYVKLSDYTNAEIAVDAQADSPALPDADKKGVLHNA